MDEIFAVSGSARMALTANVPVICEDSMHFEDLKDAVDLVSFADLPKRIHQVVTNQTLRELLVRRQNAFVAKWSEEETQRAHLELYATLSAKEVVNDEDHSDFLRIGVSDVDPNGIMSGEESRRLAEKMNRFTNSGLQHLIEPEEADDDTVQKRGSQLNEEL